MAELEIPFQREFRTGWEADFGVNLEETEEGRGFLDSFGPKTYELLYTLSNNWSQDQNSHVGGRFRTVEAMIQREFS